MTERLGPTIGLGVDDANSKKCLTHMETLHAAYGYPFQASVIVTNERGFMDIGAFAERFGRRVLKFAPVLHVSLLTGDFEYDPKHFFGEKGELHALLHEREFTPLTRQLPHFNARMNEKFDRLLEKNERYVIDEIHRQDDRFKQLFGTDSNGYDYHHGIHWAPRLTSLYVQAAREWKKPYRYDAKRSGAPRKLRYIEVYDGLNYPGVSPQTFIFKLADALKSGESLEATFHFGQHPYGPEQVRLFENHDVRSMLHRFQFALPSSMWRRVEYPET